jgi:hypothetical protein
MSNAQIGLLPLKYINDLQISNDATSPNTVLDIAAGQTNGTDGINPNLIDMPLLSGVSINSAVNGANGLDTGTLAASTWYYIYEIGSSINAQQPAALLSASATAPTLPQGYDVFRLIGYWLTDGSAHFLKGYQVGNASFRQHVWDTPIQVITNGAATSATAVDLSSAVPPVQNTLAQLNAEYDPATAGDKVTFIPGDSSATNGPFIVGSVAAKNNSAQVEVLARLVSSLPKIQYINSAASGSTNAWVQGFKYFV